MNTRTTSSYSRAALDHGTGCAARIGREGRHCWSLPAGGKPVLPVSPSRGLMIRPFLTKPESSDGREQNGINSSHNYNRTCDHAMVVEVNEW